MTSSDMQDTPVGRRAARADGPRASRPKRRTFTAAYKLAMIEKYDAATGPGAKGALLRGEGLYDSHISYCYPSLVLSARGQVSVICGERGWAA
jgi:hypothetical protein